MSRAIGASAPMFPAVGSLEHPLSLLRRVGVQRDTLIQYKWDAHLPIIADQISLESDRAPERARFQRISC